MEIQYDIKAHRLQLPQNDGTTADVRAFKATWYNKVWLFFAKLSLTNPANFVECKNIQGQSYLISRNSLHNRLGGTLDNKTANEITAFINRQVELVNSPKKNIPPVFVQDNSSTIEDQESTTQRTKSIHKIDDKTQGFTDKQMERNVYFLNQLISKQKGLEEKSHEGKIGKKERKPKLSEQSKEQLRNNLCADSEGNFQIKPTNDLSELGIHDPEKNLGTAIRSTAEKIIEKYQKCKDYDTMWKYTDSSGLILKADPTFTFVWEGMQNILSASVNNPFAMLTAPLAVPILAPIVGIGKLGEWMTGLKMGDVKLSEFGEDLKILNKNGKYDDIIQKLESEKQRMNDRMERPHWYSTGF